MNPNQNIESQAPHPFQWWALGAASGALAAFLFDPNRGRRRRALLRDQYIHWSKVTERYLHSKLVHFRNLQHGRKMRAESLRLKAERLEQSRDEAQIPITENF